MVAGFALAFWRKRVLCKGNENEYLSQIMKFAEQLAKSRMKSSNTNEMVNGKGLALFRGRRGGGTKPL